jgi:hypothetical protein
MNAGLPWRLSGTRLLAAVGAFALVSAACDAAEEQFWPEVDGFFKLDDRSRLLLMGSLTRAENTDFRAGSPRYENGKVGAHVDISLRPLFRPALQEQDWERNRYLWARIGYNYVGNYRANGETYHEDRGILELSLRQPAAYGLTLTGRLKWDLRDIDGDYSNRYRVRAGLERAFEAGAHTLVPYAHAETAYDSRYETWNRQHYQAGVEVSINKAWRIEPYLARQNDSRSSAAHINALGLILKYYH